MIIYFIFFAVVIASAIIIIYIVVKKFPNLAVMNVETIAKEKENLVRNRIMLNRLLRKFYNLRKITTNIFQPGVSSLVMSLRDFYQKTIELEKQALAQPLKQLDLAQQVKDQLAEIEKLIVAQDFVTAEENCIEVIKLDPRNLEVYKFLTEIYLNKKEYKKARETCRFLLKLLSKTVNSKNGVGDKHQLANVYSDLGWIYQLENRYTFALANFKKAVELEPSNPRFLDLLLKISILLKDKNLALQVFSDLKQADPENQKLAEIKSEIDSLPDK